MIYIIYDKMLLEQKRIAKEYIPKQNRSLAKLLARKKYLSLQLDKYKREENAIKSYFKESIANTNPEEDLLLNSSPYQELLSDFFSPIDAELTQWMNAPYNSNQKFPEQLIHKTSSGIYVRSKSESIIAMLLHIHKIPFRYECELVLGNTTIFPDFTIRHPKTGQTYYYEHFGMMNDQKYKRNAQLKLQAYIDNDILPSIQLITSYETQEIPLDSDYVEQLIKYYFL